jgi:ribosomal subunit interface protein
MTLRISGKGLDIGEAFRSHIETRISSMLEKYRAGPATGHVTVEREGAGFRADCTLHLKSGATLQADSQAHEPYASFNHAADFIENQVRRHRERLTAHHPGTAPARKVKPQHAVQEKMLDGAGSEEPSEEEAAQDETAQGLHSAVIAEPTSQLKRLTVSRAAKELDMTNAQVIVFRHPSDGRTNVVYRRPDGNIGWIDPGQE